MTTYLLWIGVITLVGYRIQRNKETIYEHKPEIDAQEITVLIPFRNEEHRFHLLLESIRNLQVTPAKFIFIDDHSTDNSLQVLEDFSKDFDQVMIVSNSAMLSGKKRALREGAKAVETRYTLTWDADISVPEDYFLQLSRLGHADMYVLPVIYSSDGRLQELYEFDVMLANAFNTGIAGWKRPIFASGANLLYRTETFENLDSIETHAHISSGDDTFLLRDFVNAKADVRLHSSPDFAVYTDSPQSFQEYLSQRIRWISKTKALKDPLNSFVAILQFVFTMGFLTLFVSTLIHQDYNNIVWLFSTKYLADLVLFFPYFRRLKRLRTFTMLPIAELWFPIYSVIVALMALFYRPTWKGRKISNK